MTKRKASVALDIGNESNQSSSTQDNNSNSTSATNNSRAARNGTSAVGSGGGDGGSGNRQGVGNSTNSGHHQKSKKERADNWSSAEIQILHRGIETRRDIFYGPPNQAMKKNRESAWEAITKEVNSVSTTPRSTSQVMKKFKNEKCRAKRKFIDEKDGHNSLSNSSNVNTNSTNNNNNNSTTTSSNNTNNTNLSAQNHANNNNQQLQNQQQQSHHMTTNDPMTSQPPSINVVKLAPQNVAKTMIDLPGHVQQIQMPSDDMVLIVPPEMDGILSGMNIVSDGNSQNHFQKCSGNSSLNNQQHSHHGQHTLQAINTGQGLINGTMSNGMMTRTIPAGSMCSLVYSTGGEVCGAEQHLANNVSGPNSLSSNHISVNTQTLMHHRGSVEQSQGQQQQQHHHQLHQLPQQPHPQQQQQQQQVSQQQPQHQHPSHQPTQHHQQHLQQNHMAATATSAITNPGGGLVVESQLKNLLFNLLLKDGQHSLPVVNSNHDYSKQRNDMLAMIASSLTKIEGHLSKISKVASSLFAQQSVNNQNSSNDNSSISTSTSLNNANISLNISNNDGNNNHLTGALNPGTLNNQGGTEA